MKRLCIYAIYDFEGKLDRYIDTVLQGIKEDFSDIIIVANYDISRYKERLNIYSNHIIERENKGYDCGAFKDGLFFMYQNLEWGQYDEVALMNDSFYGPVQPWNNMFNTMSNLDIDYWGITSSIEYYYKKDLLNDHIQGYFIVLRRKIIKDILFKEFWEKLDLPKDYGEAIVRYEFGLNNWLREHNYEGTSYMEVCGGEKFKCLNENPYINYFYELIREYDCPILKRKAINSINWKIITTLFSELSESGYYDVNQIWENWKRYDLNKKIEKYSISEVVDFCTKHSRLYVYGKGLYGKQKMEILNKLGYENAEYVVTKKDDDDEVKEIGDINFSNTDGIIIGVGPKYYDEVYKNAVSLVGVENVLTI